MNQAAQKLAKNPLGIIALFIVLVYAIAALLLGVSGSTLIHEERFPLILFLVLFPILVLAVFAWLVKNHHTKLYAPSDFNTEEGFFRARGLENQIDSIDAKAEELKEEPTRVSSEINDYYANVRGWMPANPRKEIFIIESLIFRELESKFGTTINRQVGIGDYRFDGFFTLKGAGFAVEIKLTKSKSWVSIGKQALQHAVKIRELFNYKRFEIVLAIVSVELTDTEYSAAISELAQILDNSDVPIHLKPFSYEKLIEKYGMSDSL